MLPQLKVEIAGNMKLFGNYDHVKLVGNYNNRYPISQDRSTPLEGPGGTQPAADLSPGWKGFNKTDRSSGSERPCDCHGHDQGKYGERGEVVCSQGIAKGA